MAEHTNGISRFSQLRSASDVPAGGVVSVWFGLSVGFAENAVRVSHGVLQETRMEVSDRARATLAWMEGFPRSGLHLVKTVVEASDLLIGDAMARVERAQLATIGAVDQTGNGVREATDRAVSQVIGSPRETQQATA